MSRRRKCGPAVAAESSPSRIGEPTLGDVLRDAWQARRFVAGGALCGLLGALLLLLLAVPQYQATMLVAPTTRTGTPDISALFPGNSSAAVGYVMQSFGPGDSSDFMRFESILREPSVAARLLQRQDIRQGLQGARRWAFAPSPDLSTPARLSAWLTDRVDIEPVGETRLKRVSFRDPDPAFAAHMLQVLYDTADALIRGELEVRTARRIAYLNALLPKEADPDHRRALTKLLMDQEQIAIVLAVHEPFAAQAAEPPATAPKAAWPRKMVVLPAGLFVGALLGFALFALRRSRG